ncbi:MAG: DUF3842 family protein [Chloroflexi bacterium]|nr:DUF3842 family protein [Chloroflexota bacterium]
MSTVRRWYIYLVSAISLQAVTWAIIALLRNLFISRLDPPPTAIAFPIAVILIGLPVFLAHWLWGQRLAGRATEERGATLRRFYLYGTLAAFLAPFTANAFDLIGALLRAGSSIDRRPYGLTSGDAVVYHLLALLILGVLWFYHRRVVAEDAQAIPETGGAATVRRLYALGFGAAGLTMTTLTVINLLRWIMLQFGESVVRYSAVDVGLTTEIVRLIIGVPLWLIFWRWAQRLFDGPAEEERESVLRKFYLYGAVFIGTLGVVSNGTGILAGFLRRLLGLAPEGDIRMPLSVIVGMGALWAYHSFVIRDDAEKAGEAARQAGVRRLYLYLVAGVGLSALLVGLSGDASVIIRALDKGFGSGLREELAWFTAAIVAGLPVWILPWRQAQTRSILPGPAGAGARGSTVRKIYLYLFLFVATMTVLSGAVFILFEILSWFLGSDAPTLSELGHSIAFSAIAVGVWLYHGFVLRSDHRLSGRAQVTQMQDLDIAVLDVGDGQFGRALVEALERESPGLNLEPILLGQSSDEEVAARLAWAGLIVGPWMIAVPGGDGGAVSLAVSQAVMNSPARKLLIPARTTGWEWAGVERWDADDLVRQTVRAVEQIAAGEEARLVRPLGMSSVIAIIAGALFLLFMLLILIGPVIGGLF